MAAGPDGLSGLSGPVDADRAVWSAAGVPLSTPNPADPLARRRAAVRWMLALAYLAAGILHLALPRPFLGIMPPWVPMPAVVIAATGVAEVLGAIGLLQSRSLRLRRAAGMGLALYALCVWPANVQHLLNDLARPDGGLGLGYHVPRLAAQPLLIWLALWAVRVPVAPRPWTRRTGRADQA